MSELTVRFENCYGISKLDEKFDFSVKGRSNKAYAIYAPNGLMKTSFTRSFEDISNGNIPTEERFGRSSDFDVKLNSTEIDATKIYVLRSEIDLNSDDVSVSNLLINRESKSKYDTLMNEVEKHKSKLISSLQRASKVKKNDIERQLIKDFNAKDFIDAIYKAKKDEKQYNYDKFYYNELFDPKASDIFNSREFILKAREFVDRYDEVFNECGGLYIKGVFNPTKANNSCTALEKNSFFQAGHSIQINGDSNVIGLDEFKGKMNDINKKIDSDTQLSTLKKSLSKNAQTLTIQQLLENCTSTEVDTLISRVNPSNQSLFRQELWSFYLNSSNEAADYLSSWDENKAEIEKIEKEAAEEAPKWADAIKLFNSRFVDMPFKLSLFNQSDAVLGKARAELKFIFEDGQDKSECTRSEIKALSQGEKRALYLLNFIFDVENKIQKNEETLYIIDDIADSFDYKNKHAILQYLEDLTSIDNFYQIILTHNFDFYRSLSQLFVNRNRCLMANKDVDSIKLVPAEGVNNIFIKLWKGKVNKDDSILYSCVPFTRNLIEYIKGEDDAGYLKLTKLLHWKKESNTITKGDFFKVYNETFNTTHDETSSEQLLDILFQTADKIVGLNKFEGINLQDKVLMSIAIRIKAEKYITEQLRLIKGDVSYWSDNKMFGRLLGEYESEVSGVTPALISLKKVSVTVSSNIHLNSFMYEPILDLSIVHLNELYKEISAL
ncbi:hypothetical protein L4D09_19675 [Photobacterium makurazakiensis]|uniref:hypothetical protein n=1 Tax=Photobacterium makurazakiensis TaxID=2910234 RepID=UPI003D0FEB94